MAQRTLDVQYYIWRGDTRAICCSTNCAAPPTGACALRLLWTTAARQDWTPTGALDHIRRSRCGCSTPLRSARPRRWAMHGFLTHAAAHAQQELHGRQPGQHRGWTQHRRRVLRGHRRRAVRRPGRGGHGAGGGRDFTAELRPSTGPARRPIPRPACCRHRYSYAVARAYEALATEVQRPEAQAYVRAVAQARHARAAGRPPAAAMGPAPPWSATTRPRCWARCPRRAC